MQTVNQLADGLQAKLAAAMATSGAAAAAAVDRSMYWLGVPMPVVVAAFMGAALALSFMAGIGRFRAIVIVALGTATGAYVQPLFGWLIGVPDSVWPALAFLTGLVAHTVLTVAFGAGPGALKEALGALIERIRGRG